MHILIHDIILNVKLGKTTGGDILTKTGVTGKLLIGVTIYFLPSKTIKQILDQTEEQDKRHTESCGLLLTG